MFDKHYTMVSLWCQVNFSFFLKKIEKRDKGAKADRNQISDVRSQKAASPPVAGEKIVKNSKKSEK